MDALLPSICQNDPNMKRITFLAVLCATSTLAETPPPPTGIFGAYAASQDYTPPKDPAVLKKLQAWQDQKLGLLITWGAYSQWGIVESWSLVTNRHAWNRRPPQYAALDDRAYQQVYESLITTFNPTNFNPDRWATAAKEAGIKYVLAMSKHHDGFCMWDTATTDYKITSERCPFHADPRADTIKEITAACRRQGLSTGLYFSKADWHSPDYWTPDLPPADGAAANYNTRERPAQWQRFKKFTWQQIEELMAGYGPQDILWLDGGCVRAPKMDIDVTGMAAMARQRQPGLIVVDRCVPGPNENYVTPEQEIPAHFLPYPWETCMTMGMSWSYRPHDRFKSTGTLVRNLCRIVARNGNYLLGIGIGPDGEPDPAIYARFKELGAWLALNGEAIYHTRPVAPYERGDCVFTGARDGAVYAIVLAKDDTSALPETVTLPAELSTKARQFTLLGYGPLPPGETKDGLTTITLPAAALNPPPCSHAWVIKLASLPKPTAPTNTLLQESGVQMPPDQPYQPPAPRPNEVQAQARAVGKARQSLNARGENQPGFLRVEYYPWRNLQEPERYRTPLQPVDVLIYFQVAPDEKGALTFPGEMLARLTKLKQVMNPHTQLWLGLGSLDNIAKEPRLVDAFLSDLIAACKANGFVGIDIDWEGEQVELADYERIVKRLSNALRSRNLGVATGVGIGGHYRLKSGKVIDDVDWVNIQFYFSTQNSMSLEEMSSILTKFKQAGVPASKICAGLPVYGMADMKMHDDKQSRVFAYKDMLQAGADPLRNTWLNPGNGVEYHYSGTPLIKAKTQLLRRGGYRGVFTWHLGMDVPYDSTNSILKIIDQAL
jgi:alpha-L-fucosidase